MIVLYKIYHFEKIVCELVEWYLSTSARTFGVLYMIGSFGEHGIIGSDEDDPQDDIGYGGDDLVLENGQQPFCVVSAESAIDDVRSSKVGVLQTRAKGRSLRVVAALN
jgi:hypothetical protein